MAQAHDRRADFLTGLRALVFGAFFFDLDAELKIRFLAGDRPLPPKMFSQLSEYCWVAPTRVMVMGEVAPLVMMR